MFKRRASVAKSLYRKHSFPSARLSDLLVAFDDDVTGAQWEASRDLTGMAFKGDVGVNSVSRCQKNEEWKSNNAFYKETKMKGRYFESHVQNIRSTMKTTFRI